MFRLPAQIIHPVLFRMSRQQNTKTHANRIQNTFGGTLKCDTNQIYTNVSQSRHTSAHIGLWTCVTCRTSLKNDIKSSPSHQSVDAVIVCRGRWRIYCIFLVLLCSYKVTDANVVTTASNADRWSRWILFAVCHCQNIFRRLFGS